MHNTGKVIIGLLIFLVIAAFPIWYAVAGGKTGDLPELERAVRGENCVIDSVEMREIHMALLDEWRDEVVREDDRWYKSMTLDSTIEKSLTRSCLGCHTSKANFCDRCHNYLAVSPYCWDCHVDPKEFE